MTEDTLRLSESVVPICMYTTAKDYAQIGTGFRLRRPELVVTARHVVDGVNNLMVLSRRVEEKHTRYAVVKTVSFPPDEKADLAVLTVANDGEWECFDLQEMDNEPLLGARIGSFGYPGMKKGEFTPRVMFGHIQRLYNHRDDEHNKQYDAYELGFPAFRGQSGSPVFSDATFTPHARRNILAVVTSSIVYVQDPQRVSASASWAVGIALDAYKNWLFSF